MNIITQQIQQVANQFAKVFNKQAYDFSDNLSLSKGLDAFYSDSKAITKILNPRKHRTYTITFSCDSADSLLLLKEALLNQNILDRFDSIETNWEIDKKHPSILYCQLDGNIHDWLFTQETDALNFYNLAKSIDFSYKFEIVETYDVQQRFVLYGGADALGYDELVVSMKVNKLKMLLIPIFLQKILLHILASSKTMIILSTFI